MKNRYVLCLLLCAAFLYYAVPRLSPVHGGMEGTFALSWLAFAFLVMAGNLSALLYAPKKKKPLGQSSLLPERKRMRSR
ncbi:MAG TPA: hypothetical protein VIG80_13080 [Bacillaceae bacterium]